MASKPAPTKGKAAPPPPARKPAPAAPQRQVAPPQAEAEQQAKGTEVAAVRRGGSMSTEFAKALVEGGHATGQGLSQAADDNLVPLAYILQKMSPQVESKKPEYIPGAQAGMIWLKQTGVVNADQGNEQAEGIVVQPCHFSKWIMEWIPRDQGGGLVGRFEMELGETAEQALKRHGKEFDRVQDPKNPKRSRLMTADGHELIETREHVCRAFLDNDPDRAVPYVFTMSGTNHTVSRGWMMTMNGKTLDGRKLSSYTSLYRLKTKWNQNDQGDWYNYVLEDLGRLDQVGDVLEGLDWQRELEAGKSIADAFSKGEKQANVEQYDQQTMDSHTEGGAGDGAGSGGDSDGGGDEAPI